MVPRTAAAVAAYESQQQMTCTHCQLDSAAFRPAHVVRMSQWIAKRTHEPRR